MKGHKPWAPEQAFLLPPSPRDWLPEDHLAYFILDVLSELDLSRIEDAIQAKDQRGERPYSPRMMTALLLYGYATGVFSSRRIERAMYVDVAFRVIAGGCQPHFTRISAFRREHLQALEGLFVQALQLCQRAGLVKLGHVAIDGTKVKANASKHKAMSYDRMNEKESVLTERVKNLLESAETVDRTEDETCGVGQRASDLPADLRHARRRLEKIRAAKAELEAEAKAQKELRDRDEGPPPGGPTPLPRHQIPADAEGTPAPKAQRNFTDAESRIQKASDGFIQGFNCQVGVDGANQVIVAHAVTNQPPDAQHLIPVLEQVIANCGKTPAKTTADAGYFSEANVAKAELLGTDPHIATGRRKHGPPQSNLHNATNETHGEKQTAKERMSRKLLSKEGASVYARRKAVVEPVFGQIKHARGFRQFLLRGLAKVRGEWSLICLTHNLLKLYRAPLAA